MNENDVLFSEAYKDKGILGKGNPSVFCQESNLRPPEACFSGKYTESILHGGAKMYFTFE